MKMRKRIKLLFIFLLFLPSLAFCQGQEWRTYNTENSGLPSNHINTVAVDARGDIWVGTDNGLERFNRWKWVDYNSANSGLPSNDILSIAIDAAQNVWVGTDGGLARFDGVHWVTYGPENFALFGDQYSVVAIAIGRNGNKWFAVRGDGTHQNDGMMKYDGKKWTFYDAKRVNLPTMRVNSLTVDSAGCLWGGTGPYTTGLFYMKGGLVKYDGVNWTVVTTPETRMPLGKVTAIVADNEGRKWISSDQGLGVFKGGMWKIYTTYNTPLPTNDISALLLERNGKPLAGAKEGVCEYDGTSWKTVVTHYSVLLRGDYGSLWVKRALNAASWRWILSATCSSVPGAD